MCAKKAKTTKKKIVSAAWKLFYEQGYDNTTVDDIVEESGTSKGSFYHYFEGKDALLSSLSFLFDEKYEELMPSVDPQRDGRADIEAIAAGLKSPQEAILGRGGDPEEVLDQLAEWQRMADARGVTFGQVSESLSSNQAALEDQPVTMNGGDNAE